MFGQIWSLSGSFGLETLTAGWLARHSVSHDVRLAELSFALAMRCGLGLSPSHAQESGAFGLVGASATGQLGTAFCRMNTAARIGTAVYGRLRPSCFCFLRCCRVPRPRRGGAAAAFGTNDGRWEVAGRLAERDAAEPNHCTSFRRQTALRTLLENPQVRRIDGSHRWRPLLDQSRALIGGRR